MKLSYIKTQNEKLYVRYDQKDKQWHLYEDENGERIIMRNIHIESWVADPGAKLHPHCEEDRSEMCNSLRRGIRTWEHLLDVTPGKKYQPAYYKDDRARIMAEELEAEKNAWLKHCRQGVERMRAELERLHGIIED